MIALEFARSFALSGAAALVAYPGLRLGKRGRLAACAAAEIVILLSPFTIEPTSRTARLLASIGSTAIAVKLYDLLVGAGGARPPGFLKFAASLPNPLTLVLRKLDAEPRPSAREDLVRLAAGGIGLAAGIALFVAVFRADWRWYGFAVEHVVKVLAVFGVLIPASVAGAAGLRQLGGQAREAMDHPYAARTPAEFWRRYNRPAQQFLFEDVFKPAGGLRAPVRATLVTFGVSGIIHEYVFDIANARTVGFQSMFFMLQGCAVAATARVEPKGWAAVPWIAGTLAFNLATSVLFFACLDGVVPFYSHGPPAWLRR